jgi:beta-mannanase
MIRPKGNVQAPVVTYPTNTSTYGFPVPYIGGSYDNQSFDISYPQRTQDNPTIFEDSVRTRTNGMMFFNNLCDSLPSPLAGNPNRLVRAGKWPMLTLTPETASGGTYDLVGIVAGNYDSMIQNWAGWMNGKAIIRFAHEMNISSVWGASYGASNYIALWEHVRSVWQAKETSLGLTHCPWFWCANAGSAFDAYYPGDSQCEIIGFDGYSEAIAGWPTPAQVYTPAGGYGLADLEALGSGVKPIIIGEVGVGGANTNRPAWFTSFFSLIASYPRVKGFNYWWHNNEETFDHYEFTVGTGTENDDPASAATFGAGLATWAPNVT